MIDDLFEIAERVKRLTRNYGHDHYTILRFTTNWKVCFDTPVSRKDIDKIPAFKTLEEAMIWAINKKLEAYMLHSGA